MKNILKYTSILFLGTTLASCSDFLDKDPLTNANSTGFLKTEADANKLLIGCYAKLKEPILSNGPAQSGNYLYWESLSDNCFNTSNYESFDVVMRGDHSPSTAGIVSKTWTIGFQGIADCNYFLDNIEGANIIAATKNKMKGEALFLRAYYYNELTQLYGDLPLRTTSANLNEDFFKQPRLPKADIVNQILADLDLAISYLPHTAYTNGRVVKGSAIALKTRVLLNNQKFPEAADAAWSLIGDVSNPFELHDNYSGIFFGEQVNNKEIMFSVQFLAPNDYHSLDQIIGNRMSVFPTQDLLNAYETGDPRRKMTIFETGDPWAYNPAGFQQAGSFSEGVIPFSGMAFKKWVNTALNNATGATLSDQHIVKIRYADLLLMYAEAMFESGQGGDARALKALNDVRSREGVNMPDRAALTRENIRQERRVELAFEGLRYNDLIRWGIAETVIPQIAHNSVGAKRKFKSYFFPIPIGQMDIMKDYWQQNPGWQ